MFGFGSADRRSGRLWRLLIGLQVSLLTFSVVAPIGAIAAEIQTDLFIYNNGDTVTVSGIEFGPDEAVELVTTDPVGTVVDEGTAQTDAAGAFTYAFTLNATMPGLYDVIATGQTSGLSATTQFDPLAVTIDVQPLVWYRSVSGGFDVVVTGEWSCQGNCDSATNVVVEIFPTNGVANTVGGSAVATATLALDGASDNNVDWTTTFQFRTSPGAGQFAIPSDNRYDVRATFNGVDKGAAVTAEAIRDNFLGIDNTKPLSTVTAVIPDSSGSVVAIGTASDPGAGTTGSGLAPTGPANTIQVEVRVGSPTGSVFPDSAQTVNVNASGNWSYSDPDNPTAAGTYCVVSIATDSATDGGNVQDPVGSACYTIAGANTAPVANNDAYSTNEDTPLVVAAPGVLGNDTDAEGGPLTALLVTGPAHGTLVFSSTGSFTYNPAANFNGTDSFTYGVTDGTLESNTATVTITVNSVNDAPVASNDAYSTNEDTPLIVAAPGVLANDTDVEGDSLTTILVSGPSHGALILHGDGSFSYTPAVNFNGTDSFTYRATDGTANSNLATVTITVNAVNDAPVVEIVSGLQSVNESTSAAHEYEFVVTDVDGGDSFTIVAGFPNCGIGGVRVGIITLTPTGGLFDCRFPDGPATPDVQVKVRDAAGAESDLAIRAVSVANVHPNPTVDPGDNIEEGDTVAFEFSTTDPGADTFAFVSFDCGVLGEEVVGSGFIDPITGDGGFSCSFADDVPSGTPFDFTTVSVVVEDDDGAFGSGSTSVAVNNVAPTVILSGEASPEEGTTHVYSYTSTDPGVLDEFTLVGIDCGINGDIVPGSDSFDPTDGSGSFSCSFPDDNPSGTPADPTTVHVEVSDDDDGHGIFDIFAFVHNVNPVAEFGGDRNAAEGALVAFDVVVTDQGTFDTFVGNVWLVTCDYGQTEEQGFFPFDHFEFTPTDNGECTVEFRVSDDDGGEGIDVATVTVSNVPPSVVVSGASTANEGESKTYAFDTTDPGADDTFEYSGVSCGTGALSGSVTFDAATGDGSFTCLFADDNPTGSLHDDTSVGITITDDDGGVGTGSKPVTIHNLAPVIGAVSFTFNPVTHVATATAAFTDAGVQDSHSADFTWSVVGSTSGHVVTSSNGVGSASESLTLGPGCYTITVTVTVTDDDTGSDTETVVTGYVADAYAISFRPPIKDNERNIVKFNNVLPVKVVLNSSCAPGTTVTTPDLYVTLSPGAGGELIEDTNIVVESVSAADTGQKMRIADGGYIYNLSLKGLGITSDYTIRIRLGGATLANPVILDGVIRPKK